MIAGIARRCVENAATEVAQDAAAEPKPVSTTDQIASAELGIRLAGSLLIERAVVAGVLRSEAQQIVSAYTNDMLSDLFYDLREELEAESADEERRSGRW